MIKLVVEAAGLLRLLVRVRLLPFYLALIRSYKNTLSNNSLIATNKTMHALEVGCTKVTNTLVRTES